MSKERIQLWLIRRKDDLRPPGFTKDRAFPAILDDTVDFSEEPSFEASSTPIDGSISSTGSSNKESFCSVFSQSSAGSTTPSTVPSTTGPQQLLHAGLLLNPITAPLPHPENVLCCEFVCLGCNVRFHPDDYADYESHSISHFQDLPLPTKSVCIFCDDEVFESTSNPEAAWRDRMRHISNHLQEPGHRFETARPDYLIAKYLRANNLLDAGGFAQMMRHTERTKSQRCPGLLPAGGRPKEMKRKEEKDVEQLHDLDKERRLMKKLEKGRAGKRSGT
jgi:hypothetical protein